MVRRLVAGAGVAALAVVGFSAPSQAAPDASCWGQASKMFAQAGTMGEHSSSFDTPRLGLRNLARAALGPEATMADLGVFVATELGYEIEACGT